MKRTEPSGFSIIELLIIIVVVVVIGLLVYVGYTRWQENGAKKTDTIGQQDTNKTANETPSINTTGDLDSAANTLDQTDLADSDNSDITQLEDQLSAF